MEMMTFGPFEGTVSMFRRRLARSLAGWSEPSKLAVVYLPADARHEEYLAAVEELTGVPVVGATTGGAAFTERGATKNGVVGAVLGGSDMTVACAAARNLHLDLERGVKEALSVLEGRSASLGPRNAMQSSLLVLSDPFGCDGEELVDFLRQGVAVHTRILGCSAGDDWTFEGARVFFGKKVLRNAAILVRMTHRQRIIMDVLHGFRFVEDARDFTITDIEHAILKTLDGRPAAAVYEAELSRLGLLQQEEGVLQAMATHQLGAKTPFGEEIKIRGPISIGSDGSIRLSGGLPRGQVVRVVTTTPERLLDSARRLSARVLKPDMATSGVLIFDCAARLRVLKDRYDDEIEALRGAGKHPMLGTTTFGEIAKFGGNVESFHNITAVMVGWGDPVHA